MIRTKRDHLLATVLFTDIVSSSVIAAELGDRRWRVLLARHHLIVRKALKRHGGKEIDNAGDGFFAAFDDQADGIRCACEISDAVKELGIDIRAGLHVGQAEVVGKKLGGLAVNVGARVMSLAEAGEVLVSGVLRELVAGSGFTFEDRGLRELKGVPGEWHLYAVTAVDGQHREPPLAAEVAVDRRESIKPPPLLKRRSGKAVAAVLILALSAVVTVAFLLLREEPVSVAANSLVRINASTKEIVAAMPLGEGADGQIAPVGADEIWVMTPQDDGISVFDIESNTRVRTVEGSEAYGITYSDGSVWATGPNSTVLELDKDDGQVISEIPVAGGAALLAQGYGAVWVMTSPTTKPYRGDVVAIDPDTDDTGLKSPVGRGTNGIGVGMGFVWASNYLDNTVSRVDPNTGEVTEFRVGLGPSGIGFGFNSVWVSNVGDGTVSRIDPETLRTIETIEVGRPSRQVVSSIATAGGGVWVSSPSTNTIALVDPATNEVDERISVPFPPLELTAAFGSIWVAIGR